MGVEVTSTTIVGIYAGDYMEDVVQILVDKGILTDYDQYEDEFGGCRYTLFSDKRVFGGKLEAVLQDAYCGTGYYIGFEGGDWRDYQSQIDEFNALTGLDGDVHTFERWH